MKNVLRCTLGLAALLGAASIGYVAGAQNEPAKPERTLTVNEVARVGERVITAEEFIQRLVEREDLHADDATLRTATWALDSLLLEEMLTLECTRLGAVPKRREWDAEFALLDKMFDEQLARENRALKTPYTKKEYLEKRRGLSLEQYEMKMRDVAKLRLQRRMVVNYWLVSTESADAAGLLITNYEAALEIRGRLQKGEKIGPIAEERSEDMITRNGRGVLGTIYPRDGTLETDVDAAFWKLKDGEWSEPVSTSRGYWIIGRVKTYLANEAQFFDMREDCLTMPDPTDAQLLKWRHALASSGRIKYERRMPGWDVQAGQK